MKRTTLQRPDGTDLYDSTANAIPVVVIPGEGGGVGDSVQVTNIPHVIVDSMPAGGAGLTDTELRASAVPVSVTFPATQAVSAAALPLPSGAATSAAQTTGNASLASIDGKLANPLPVTGTFYQATQPISGTVGVSGSVAVTGTFWQATQPVSGTFWQATQPVSGPLTDTQLRAVAVPVSGTFWQATQPVSGTFWQATQPVSIAATVAVSGPLTDAQLRAVAVPVSGTFWQATQPVSIASLPALAAGTANIGDVDVLTLPALPAGTNNIGDVDVLTLPALPTGTNTIGKVQCANLTSRIRVIYKFHNVAPATADTLLSLTRLLEGQADSTTTTFAVTSGKRQRIQGIKLGVKANAAAAAWATATVRVNTAGAAVIGSPSYFRLDIGLTAAAASSTVTPAYIDFGDDGIELSGTEQIGISLAAQAVTNIISLEMWGYEYTP